MDKLLIIICVVCLGLPIILSFKAKNPRKFRRYGLAVGFCAMMVAILFVPKDKDFVVREWGGGVAGESSGGQQENKGEREACTLGYASDIDLSMYTVVEVVDSSATNFKETASHAYPTSNLFDEEMDTCWQDGVEGYGEGTEFFVTLSESSNVQYIVIQNGRARSDEKFVQNGRVYQLEINNGLFTETVELPDVNTPIAIKVNGWEGVSFVSFKIISVYYGSEYEDTCISEITFYR